MAKSTTEFTFDALPLDPTGPPGNAWGRFGKDDQLGTLNLLTPERIVEAAKEIKTGVRISLDWPLSMPSHPSFNRDPFKQELVLRSPNCIFDDILSFNSQGSTQWDGFRHYGIWEYDDPRTHADCLKRINIQKSSTMDIPSRRSRAQILSEFIVSSGITSGMKSRSLTAIAMCEHGGITGRGVLVDYADWAATNSISVSALESETIPLEHIKQVVKDHKIEFQKGDILFIRSGFTAAYNKLNDQQRKDLALRSSPDFNGVEASEGMVRWLWEHQFAAVAGDAPSFERAPIRGAHADPNFNLHEWVLAGWGTPIGEMFDLEKLSEHCKATGRYSFFLSSMPLKVVGGVASPPNAFAIF
ncbi:unnamed protein product [Penicillium salamii]|nr:unnamed protein product [Penicillium salamii]CAG7996490.1 unnamed protein product [Penicillium salamii]CAG8289180.1 unnamed protein product [Penicillium salamii]